MMSLLLKLLPDFRFSISKIFRFVEKMFSNAKYNVFLVFHEEVQVTPKGSDSSRSEERNSVLLAISLSDSFISYIRRRCS